ncbi:MAG: YciI family protein [Gemmataceae bacterium]
MKYMLLIHGPEDAWTEDERTECMLDSLKICDELAAKDKLLDVSPLLSVKTAATVRVRQGRVLVTDGPFAETTEHLGGYYIVDLPDLDEAIAIASRLPPVTKGVVEIRPLAEMPGLPESRRVPDCDARKPFLLLCYDDESAWEKAGSDALDAARAEAAELAQRLAQEDRYISASPLHSSATATCVRVRNGKRVITDGPFAETHEVLGGFYLIMAEDRDVALRFAAQHSGARLGSVEVRQLFDLTPLRRS